MNSFLIAWSIIFFPKPMIFFFYHHGLYMACEIFMYLSLNAVPLYIYFLVLFYHKNVINDILSPKS